MTTPEAGPRRGGPLESRPKPEPVEGSDAERYAAPIASLYEKTWLATYPNEELGITEADLASNFSDAEAAHERWRAVLEDPAHRTWIVPNADQSIAGFCVARHGEDENELEYLYVSPDAQGRGVGSALIQEALAWLGTDKPVVLYGAAYNANAIAFYERFGFQLSHEVVPPKRLENGKELPSMKMVRPRG